MTDGGALIGERHRAGCDILWTQAIKSGPTTTVTFNHPFQFG